MYLLLEIGNNILAQVSMQKIWKKNIKWNFFSRLSNFAKSWLTPKTGWPGEVRPTSSFFSQFSKTILCFPKWLETTKKQLLTLI